MIPAEAVEAAYDKFQHLGLNASDIEGILETAAPHIIAGHFRDMNLKAITNEIENPPNFSKSAP